MKQLLLINPHSPFFVDPKVFPPLGLLYLGAAAEAAGYEVRFVDLNWEDSLEGHHPGLIGIMCLTPHFPRLKDLIGKLRSLYPGVPVAVGGAHFSTCPDDYEEVGADAVCLGDGEEVIVQMLQQDQPRGKYWSGDKWTVDVNRHPVPARHLTDIKRYRYTLNQLPATTLVTQRGCPYECTFCCHWTGYRSIRLREVANVVEELHQLKEMGFRAVMIYDDEINIVHKRTLELAEGIQSVGIPWRAFIKSNLFNEEQAKAFAEAGCWELCTGIESGSDEVLKTIKKKSTVAQNTRSRELCRKYGIRFKAFCMVGHPGETEETAQSTKQWLLENRPDEFNVALYTPYLGTPVVDHPEQFDIDYHLNYKQEEFFYLGKPGESPPNASTSSLSAQRLSELRQEIEDDVRAALGLERIENAQWFGTRVPDVG